MIKLFACGDIVNSTANKFFVSDELKKIIENSDVSICNFEAPINVRDMQPINKAGPHVSQSVESVGFLKESGFDVLSIANNHIYDYGDAALSKTMKEIEHNNLDYIGAGNNFEAAFRPKIFEKNGIKIGLLAGCENEFGCLYENQNRGGYAWINHSLIEDNIRGLKENVDVVILIAHAGVENIDFPIKEWRDRYQRLCDVGVDVVIGHHPHVPQGYEEYNNSVIFYSLGNFYFDTASFETKRDDSYSVSLELDRAGLVKFDILYHKKISGQTVLVNESDVNFSIEHLNSLLERNYCKRNDDVSINLFHKYYYAYYESALGVLPKNSSIANKIKYIIKKILFNNQERNNRNLLLLHNIRIDSHRYVVQRALSLISEKGNQ